MPLHLVRPLGFELTDKYLKRAGLDYWPHIELTVHDNLDEVLSLGAVSNSWFLSARAEKSIWDVSFGPDDLLVFGCETKGLPRATVEEHREQLVAIPHNDNIRCLNLANSVSIVVYEALRQNQGVSGPE
jgi:tRNA (cytidine/uridine-2'-O-)-methyltransferase